MQTPFAAGGARTGSTAPATSWLCCEVGGQVLAVPTVALREIVRAQGCTPLPLTPPWVRGLMNLRGSPLPVLDLAARLGMPAGVDGHRCSVLVVKLFSGERESGESSLPGARAEGVGRSAPVEPPLGLWVDRVLDIVDLQPQKPDAVSPFGHAVPARFVAQVLRRNREPVPGLDLEQVLNTGELAHALTDHATQACIGRRS